MAMRLRPHSGAPYPEKESGPQAECFPCNLRNLYVPVDLAWQCPPFTEGRVGPLAGFWDDLNAEAKTRSHRNMNTLQEQCDMRGSLNEFVATSLERKRHSVQGSAQKGLFLLFSGDSFMRITMVSMLTAMTNDDSVIRKAQFNLTLFHSPHVFCCEGYQGIGSNVSFHNCGMEYAGFDVPADEMKQLVRNRMSQGQVCLVWQFVQLWREQRSELGQWMDVAAPDMLVVNGGLHYHDWGPNQTFEKEFDVAMAAVNSSMLSPKGAQTSLVVVSSTYNSYHSWEPQAAAYEHVRNFVRSWRPEAVQGRVSYVDFHTLAGLDSCGFSHKFPAQAFREIVRDACGNFHVNSNIHLAGGAYLHLAELVSFVLFRERRRCDPAAFEPLDIDEWTPSSSEDAELVARYIKSVSVSPKRANMASAGMREYLEPPALA